MKTGTYNVYILVVVGGWGRDKLTVRVIRRDMGLPICLL